MENVKVEKVFKGKELHKGDVIEMGDRAGVTFFGNDDTLINGMHSINMNFVNEMIPGKVYLIFLDQKLETYNDEKIYMQSDEVVMSTAFSYDKQSSVPCTSITDKGNFVKYKTVRNNEFFIESESGIKKMEDYKETLIKKYPYTEQ